ncbi:947_t:CDS:2 [Racocetra persica]|uniref:947_t:CDS:1 n=1 Tax=Racocetra persica TaxID=160502 RepID=A0ACA9ML74_9GLOM|nr:947_t:CDS:2 [Racocetra persica]
MVGNDLEEERENHLAGRLVVVATQTARTDNKNVEENEIIQEYREEEDWYRVYAFEIGGGLTIRHTPNEIALEIYRSYQFGVLRRENKIAGLEEVDYQPNEEELRRLKREMDAKMREIIAEETWQGSLEVIRDLFKENQETGEEISTTADRTDDINDTTGNNNFGYLGPLQKKLRAREGGKTIPSGVHKGKRKRLRNEYIKAKSKSGDTGTNLLASLESRLDNIIFRSGLANTLRFARQLVSHAHFLVDGKKVKTCSYKVKAGQVISLRKQRLATNKLIKNNLEQNTKIPLYLNVDKQKIVINCLREPTAEELSSLGLDTSLLIE